MTDREITVEATTRDGQLQHLEIVELGGEG